MVISDVMTRTVVTAAPHTPVREVAEIMRERRFELCAWMILEAGKQWREADGELC